MSSRTAESRLCCPSLDEIENAAVVTMGFWLDQAEAEIDGQFGAGYAGKHPAIVAGFLLACGAFYHAERMTDAAAMLASAIAKKD